MQFVCWCVVLCWWWKEAVGVCGMDSVLSLIFLTILEHSSPCALGMWPLFYSILYSIVQVMNFLL